MGSPSSTVPGSWRRVVYALFGDVGRNLDFGRNLVDSPAYSTVCRAVHDEQTERYTNQEENGCIAARGGVSGCAA